MHTFKNLNINMIELKIIWSYKYSQLEYLFTEKGFSQTLSLKSSRLIIMFQVDVKWTTNITYKDGGMGLGSIYLALFSTSCCIATSHFHYTEDFLHRNQHAIQFCLGHNLTFALLFFLTDCYTRKILTAIIPLYIYWERTFQIQINFWKQSFTISIQCCTIHHMVLYHSNYNFFLNYNEE